MTGKLDIGKNKVRKDQVGNALGLHLGLAQAHHAGNNSAVAVHGTNKKLAKDTIESGSNIHKQDPVARPTVSHQGLETADDDAGDVSAPPGEGTDLGLSLIHISEPTRLALI
eukprot:8107859-Alexandrium_andersonii.AAC.2